MNISKAMARPRMHGHRRLWALLVVLTTVLTMIPPAMAVVGPPVPDGPVDLAEAFGPAGAPDGFVPELATLQDRFVTVDVPRLGVLLDRAAVDGVPVRLPLTGGQAVTVALTDFVLHDDGFTASGRAGGSVDQVVVLSAADPTTLPPVDEDPLQRPAELRPDEPVLRLDAWVGARRWSIRSLGGGLHVVSELDVDVPLPPVDGHVSPSSGESEPGGLVVDGAASAEGAAAAGSESDVVDVLVLYTAAADAAVSEPMGTWAAQQLEVGNQANAASGIPFRFRLVHVARTMTTETTNAGNDLDDLRDPSHPRFAEAHGLRDTYGADVVMLLGRSWSSAQQNPVCGLAYWMDDAYYGSAFAGSTFGVVDVAAGCTAQHTLVHEVGHNLGLQHDRANARGTGSHWTFNYGHYDAVGDFRTVMSYDSVTCPGTSCTPIPNWSDPNRTYNGRPTGVADDGSPTSQLVSADNARALRDSGPVVAGFRQRRDPFGSLDGAARAPGGIRVSGWSIDLDAATDPIQVHSWDYAPSGASRAYPMTADGYRGDVGQEFPAAGPYHGYSQVVGIVEEVGSHKICTYGINVGPGVNVELGCAYVSVAFDPIGNFEKVERAPGGVAVVGWALDPDTASPITLHAYVGGQGTNIGAANLSRPDVAAAYPDYGPNHGFNAVAPTTLSGPQQVCVYGINVAPGTNNASIGCRTITITYDPFGTLNSAPIAPGGLAAYGWVIDPDTQYPIQVQVRVDGVLRATDQAGHARGDVGAVYPRYGSNHGFSVPITTTKGTHEVCVTAVNYGLGANTLVGPCRTTTVSNLPFGSLDSAVRTSPTLIRLRGWTIDPDVYAPIDVRVDMAGLTVTTLTADQSRGDVGAAYPYFGSLHGFDITIPAPPVTQTVCVTALNVGAGTNRSIACRTV